MQSSRNLRILTLFCIVSQLTVLAIAQINSYCQLIEPMCTTDILQQRYRDQNMCLLYHTIPKELQQLPYAVYPICVEYDTERFSYNKRFNIFPHAIFIPRTAQEVAYVLSILRQNKLRFSLRSGGHCYEPGSLSSGYVIDLRNFNSITVSSDQQEAYIGAGCTLGSVIETLAQYDLAIPTGTCPSVGVAGLALGGGIGLLTRKYGLTCDAVKRIILMTASGEIIEVDETRYCDLFWALRGAGNNAYGIVLGFVFTVYSVPQVTTLKLEWPWNPAIIYKIVQAWQSWITCLPNEISTELHFKYRNCKPFIEIIAVKVGVEPFCEWKAPFNNLSPRSTVIKERYIEAARRFGNIHTIPYIDAAKEFAGVYTMPFSKVKSKFLFRPLSREIIKHIILFFDTLKKHKEPFFAFFEFSAGGGKMAEGKTAFYPRHALTSWFQFVYWNKQSQSSRALQLINNFYATVEPYCSCYSYSNLPDYDLGKRYLCAYYGSHVYRLLAIKKKYDPENIFCWRQGIPVCKNIHKKTP